MAAGIYVNGYAAAIHAAFYMVFVPFAGKIAHSGGWVYPVGAQVKVVTLFCRQFKIDMAAAIVKLYIFTNVGHFNIHTAAAG